MSPKQSDCFFNDLFPITSRTTKVAMFDVKQTSNALSPPTCLSLFLHFILYSMNSLNLCPELSLPGSVSFCDYSNDPHLLITCFRSEMIKGFFDESPKKADQNLCIA